MKKQLIAVAAIIIGLLVACAPVRAAQGLGNHGGPIMQSVTANVIFWLPPNSHFVSPPNDIAANDQAYENAITSFFQNLAGTSYLNITSQYWGQCGSSTCTAPMNQGGVSLGRVIVDQTPYPQSTLSDSDIQNEIKNQIAQLALPFDLSTEFFVFTAAGQQECHNIFGINQCTSSDFCAYHWSSDFNGSTIVYAYMPAADSLGGCTEGISSATPGRLLAADREIVALSHELFESITDPISFAGAVNFPDLLPFGRTTWWDSNNVFGTNYGNEIGDECNNKSTSVQLNALGTAIVQPQWSNDISNCVSFFGPSVRFDVGTGSDDLRGDSSATAALQSNGSILQTVTLKNQTDNSWSNNSAHARVFGLIPAQLPSASIPLTGVNLTLTSHSSWPESPDGWNIESLGVRVLDPTGNVVCASQQGGDPLVRLSGSVPSSSFAMSNCPFIPAPVQPTFSQIRLVITTGGDDLRGDSSATVALLNPGGAIIQTFPLKNQSDAGWSNNTTKDLTFSLGTPLALSSIGSVSITLTSHSSWPENDDNWKIQVANLTLQGGSPTPPSTVCFANGSGNPFIQLTAKDPTVVFSANQGC